MQYGHFADQQREYIITQPDTPTPWINYLGCETYFGLISNTAGGYSFYRDARMRRLTRYRYNNAPSDTGGRYLYLRDNRSGSYWSPTWQPTQTPLEDYTCRHGLGYTIIGSTYAGIKSESTYFVPLGDTLEIWQLRLTNLRAEPADMSVFSSVEFCQWDAQEDATNFQRNLSTGEVEVEDGVIYHKTEYRERRDHFAFFACSEPLAGFDTQRETFLGAYHGWDRPAAVIRGESFNSIAHGWAPVGSHHVHITLQPGETRQIIFLLGYHENPHDQKFDPPTSQVLNKRLVKPVIAKYLDGDQVAQAFANLRAYWDDLLSIMQVETPNIHTNRMVNIWNAYQCMATFNMSRSASFYESGIGRGLGFRDSNQDLLAFVQMGPDRSRERILDLAATQLASGGAFHQYQPLTKRGNNDIGSNFNDDPLWLILSVAAYLKETGDWSILDAPAQYENQPGSEQPLYDHLQRCLRYTLNRIGPHGLPLIGRADWNDPLTLNGFSEIPGENFQTTTNQDGKVAESIFIAALFILGAKELAAIADQRGLHEESRRYLAAATEMDQVVHKDGWDGEWFVRAYDHYGKRVGAQECAEGKIFIEPQGFCVMAGIGLDDGLARRALDSVNRLLATPHGILILQPAYSRYYLHLGEISSYPQGYKENGGIFCHNNPWVIIAETIVGHGDRAFDYYLRINPSVREAISDIHRCEPYVYSQMIAGREAPTFGEAKNSWLTGTAAWNYVAITQRILGIRPELDGLYIAPVIPTDWPGFTARRKYRGVTYHINVVRAGQGNAAALVVNGQPHSGNYVPLPPAGQQEVQVDVTLT